LHFHLQLDKFWKAARQVLISYGKVYINPTYRKSEYSRKYLSKEYLSKDCYSRGERQKF
jgi:hypothetical protein